MKTQIERARENSITPQMETVARDEGLPVELICERVAKGEIVIANNPSRPQQKVVGIGTGLRTKVNASIGTSSDICAMKKGMEVFQKDIAGDKRSNPE